MAMTCQAYEAGTTYRFVVTLNDSKQIPDPSLPAPAEGEQDTRPLVQDPAWVLGFDWGKEPPEGQTVEEYLASCKREALLLGELELQRRQPPQEIILP